MGVGSGGRGHKDLLIGARGVSLIILSGTKSGRSRIGVQRRPQSNNYVTCKINKIIRITRSKNKGLMEPGVTPWSSILKHVRE